MLFVDPLFLFVFLPLALASWRMLGHFGVGENGLLAAVIAVSLAFYSWTSVPYTLIPMFSVAVNWSAGMLMSRAPARAGWIAAAAVVLNLFQLGVFKYAEFLGGFMLNLALPLGISFFTFQQISYIIDVYKTRLHERSLLRYAFIVTFFPHLIAGPIVRYSEFRPQFPAFALGRVLPRNRSLGVFLILVGLVKKIVFADTLAPLADTYFSHSPEELRGQSAAPMLLAGAAFYLQIYFDFSGYTDIAIGLARLFNIKFPKNFDYPYAATSVSEFWHRWHITLSRFLRDYLYIPLGGNRATPPRVAVNLMVTMLLGGLWHGAAWNFVVWGGMHGLALVAFRVWKTLGVRTPVLLAWGVTQAFLVLTWIVFRAPSLSAALASIGSLGNVGGDAELLTEMIQVCYESNVFRPLLDAAPFQAPSTWVGMFIAVAWVVATFRISAGSIARLRARPVVWTMALTALSTLAAVVLWGRAVRSGHPDPFIYFQF